MDRRAFESLAGTARAEQPTAAHILGRGFKFRNKIGDFLQGSILRGRPGLRTNDAVQKSGLRGGHVVRGQDIRRGGALL